MFAIPVNIGMLSYAAVGGSLVPYFAGCGFAEGDAALLAGPLLAIPNLIGKLGFGRIADTRLGPLRTFVAVFAVLAVSMVLFNLAAVNGRGGGGGGGGGSGEGTRGKEGEEASLLLVGAATVLFGAGYGGFIAMQHTSTMHVFGLERYGAAMGILQGLVILPAIGGPLLTGTPHDTMRWATT
eukprot:COSAG02_NODE_7953_length_2773_cov_2.439043_3_plen_182_part_00